jgi:hypothetical protein
MNCSIKEIKFKLLGKLDFHTIDDNFVIGFIQYTSTHPPIPLTLMSTIFFTPYSTPPKCISRVDQY